MLKKFFWSIVLIAGLVACHKDSDSILEEEISTFSPEIVELADGCLHGYVYDEAYRPVEDAVVETYSGTVRTNKFGVFRITNGKVDRNGTYIRVSKAGYVTGSDLVHPAPGGDVYAYVQLLRLETHKSFEAQSGGTVDITGGGKVIFGPDAIATSSGAAYSGKVVVTAKLLKHNDPDLSDKMPGGLIGRAANGNTVVMGTTGMIAVELRSENGQKLNLKNGSKARIEIPADDPAFPASIPLWYFDESKGIWIEEGYAQLINGFYTGEVSHFSFWNCDAPFPLINVCGKVVFENGAPAQQLKVAVMADGLNTGFGYTDDKGKFCGKMPKGKVLTFKVMNGFCEGVLFEKQSGPFDSNIELDPFVLNVSKTIVFGTVKCNGETNPNATIVVKIGNQTKIYNPGQNGQFEINLTNFLCPAASDIRIFAFDNNTGQAGPEVTVTPGIQNELTLESCTSPCDFEGQLIYNCEDHTLSVSVTGGIGGFTYLWSNGATGTTPGVSPDSLIGVYCVTVTAAGGSCSKNYCKQINRRMQVAIGNNCQNPQKIISTVQGGTAPYSYLWSNGSTNNFTEISAAGNYCLTVTDAAGCSKSVCKDLSLQGMYIESTIQSCNKASFTLNTSPFAQGRIYSGNAPGTSQGVINVTYPITQSVFNTGFNFSVTIWDEVCEAAKQISLPQFKGLNEPTVTNTTCDTCTNGKINITVNNGADCLQCTPGAIRIFKTDDLDTDLSTQNDSQMLGKGDYYVVVVDANSGCYIAFRKVKIL
jgi:hypothetical protein